VTPFVICEARTADVPVLRDICRRASMSNDSDRAHLLDHPDALELSDLAVIEGRTRTAVADSRIIGFASWRADGPVIEIEDMFVDPDYMGHGAGRQLLLDLITIARGQSARRVEVTAGLEAVGFYQKAGFAVARRLQTRFGPAPRMYLELAP
jgi:GNAT superfamily N-acetyltransferase